MPRSEAPLIDRRTYSDLVSEVEDLMQTYTAGSVEPSAGLLVGARLDQAVKDGAVTIPAGTLVTPALAQKIAGIQGLGLIRVKGWQKPLPGEEDAGWALARIFGRMAELVVTRLNRLPDRNFLAFLDLIGSRLNPPQPARVPLTFQLAAGSLVDALVPAGTQAAALALEGEAVAPLFETERDLIVTRSQLAAVYTREPGRDLWADHTAATTFSPFRGDRKIEHRLHVSELALFAMPEDKRLDLLISPANANNPWLSAVTWTFWNGLTHQPVTPVVSQEGTDWRVRFTNLPRIAPSAVSGLDAPWLHGRLNTYLARGEVVQVGAERELRRRGALPAVAYAELAGDFDPIDFRRPFLPFGDDQPFRTLYLSTGDDFTKPKSWIEIDIALDASQPPTPAGGLAIVWEYWGGAASANWKPLTGTTFTPAAPPAPGKTAAPFLVDGTLRFRRPDDWVFSQVKGAGGSWLRARVTQGNFGSSAPVVERLTLGDDWQLPRVDSLRVAVTIDHTDAALRQIPERGFSNQVPVDLSKDFLPFGDKPRVGDAFYVANEEAFSKPLATAYLHFTTTDTGTAPLPDTASILLAWECWDGREWRFIGNSAKTLSSEEAAQNAALGFTDSTDGFTKAGGGTVSFPVPAALAPVDVNGEVRRWVRVRIAKGSYGADAKYTLITGSNPPQYQLTPATFKPPSMKSVRLGYNYAPGSTIAQLVLAENDTVFADVSNPAAGAGDFTPFIPSQDRWPTLYLGFERPGDVIGFANRLTSLFFQVSEALFDPAVEQQQVTEEASVVWEYWNGEEWERLGVRDETRGFARRGLVTFIGPADFRASTEMGRTAFWLRGRWERGEYAVEPRLDRVLTNTTWGVHAQTVLDEVLGSSLGERGQVFRTLRAPVLEGQLLEVIEPEVPSGADLADLEAEEGDGTVTVVRDAAGQFVAVRVRWREVPDFYGSGPRSRHYVLDHSTGEVRFGDGRRGLIPPPGRNNIRMVRYQAGGGLAGNRPAGSISQLKGTVPYVGGVVQLVAAEGGAAEESLEAVRSRGPKMLRHRNRATAAVDYEDLAFEASSQVARAQALPARSNVDGGRVGLIVVPASASAKPVPGLELLERVRSYIEARVSPVVDFWVVGPDWLQVDVRAEVVPQRLEAVTEVQTAVLDRLRSFLHPLTGGPEGEGWEFGRKPHRSDLYALIEETPGVDHVRQLEVTETPREGGARPGRFLVFSGNHEIALSGNTDDFASGSLS
ncbi:MAG: hypothetical protein QOH06_5082 [Acidobacteriota bacterium]|jgi:hypothetical protein|nr:hypothetical protein [Acidobacteriota bacterium]